MRFLFLFVAFITPVCCFSQNRVFVGRVVDKDRKGIPFAVVEAKDRNQGVYCDENGIFSFTGNAEEIKTLLFFCLGYEKKEISTEILPMDSIIVMLNMATSSLNMVTIKSKTGKRVSGVLGKKHPEHDGECYRFYGSETAIKLNAEDDKQDGILKTVNVYITKEGDWRTKFRIHIYEYDSLPGREITDSNIIVQAEKANSWVKIDLSNKRIPVNEGVFVSVEWISGFGNTEKSLQSEKHPEVTNYNGQVLGLTDDYGKASKTYSRKPFSKTWEYFDDANAPRKGGYFLNPMIYCTYSYIK